MALVDLTLGRFYKSDSLVHRLNSSTKLLVALLLMAASLCAKRPASFLLLYAFLAVAIGLSRVPLKYAVKNLKFFVWLIALAVFLNLFFTEGTVIARLEFLNMTFEGIVAAAVSVCRLVLVITAASVLTLTTAPLDLTYGISRPLGFLTKLKVPIHELGLMSAFALSYVPVLVDEVGEIALAQRSRGAPLDGKGLRALRSAVFLLVPVILSTFRKADTLALAMESRCFRSCAERTRLIERRMRRADYISLVLSVILVSLALLVAR